VDCRRITHPAHKADEVHRGISPRPDHPALAARIASTFDRISNGRVLTNIVTGSSDAETAAGGLILSHDERYELADEFLTTYRKVADGEQVTL
jgi:alkanesulfonate monooxygenase